MPIYRIGKGHEPYLSPLYTSIPLIRIKPQVLFRLKPTATDAQKNEFVTGSSAMKGVVPGRVFYLVRERRFC
jgi:hypothetical protein